MKQFWTTACLLMAGVTLLMSLEGPSLAQDELLRKHPQANLLFDLPSDFSVSTDWPGYEKPRTESSILVSENDERPFDVLVKGFFKADILAKTKREVVSREECKLNGLSGIKVKLRSKRDGKQSDLWAVLFGDEYGSCLVLGMVFDDYLETDGPVIQHAVNTVVWDRPERIEPFDHIDYTIDKDAIRVLKYAGKGEGMVTFTFGGKIDATMNPGRPRLIVRRVEKGIAKKEEREALVRAQLEDFPNLTDFKVDSIKEIEIDGIKGIEGRASAVSSKFRDLNRNLMTVTLLQVTLFEDDHYYSMNGVISTAIARNWMQMYEAGIHSFARKPVEVKEEKAKEEGEEKGEETPEPPK